MTVASKSKASTKTTMSESSVPKAPPKESKAPPKEAKQKAPPKEAKQKAPSKESKAPPKESKAPSSTKRSAVPKAEAKASEKTGLQKIQDQAKRLQKAVDAATKENRDKRNEAERVLRRLKKLAIS